MLFCGSSLLAGVDASAAQKQPVTKTCLQCGAILPSGILACRFCDSMFQAKLAAPEGASVLSRWGADPPELACDVAPELADDQLPEGAHISLSNEAAENVSDPAEPDTISAWRGELANRVEAYRVRRRKVSPGGAQSRLPFVEPTASAVKTVSARATTSQRHFNAATSRDCRGNRGTRGGTIPPRANRTSGRRFFFHDSHRPNGFTARR